MAQFAIPWLLEGRVLSRVHVIVLLAALSLVDACGKSGGAQGDREVGGRPMPAGNVSQTESPSRSPVSANIQAVATSLLGSNAEVVALGNLAGNGHVQMLVVNRVLTSRSGARQAAPRGVEEAVPFTRAAVIQRDGARWIEVLRCDEHLKNSRGFLAGTPLSPVNGWVVQWKQQEDGAVQTMYFTPSRGGGVAIEEPIAVRWNPALNRYQSIDRTNHRFLNELALLETPTSILK